jgi:hypothetical protein
MVSDGNAMNAMNAIYAHNVIIRTNIRRDIDFIVYSCQVAKGGCLLDSISFYGNYLETDFMTFFLKSSHGTAT